MDASFDVSRVDFHPKAKFAHRDVKGDGADRQVTPNDSSVEISRIDTLHHVEKVFESPIIEKRRTFS